MGPNIEFIDDMPQCSKSIIKSKGKFLDDIPVGREEAEYYPSYGPVMYKDTKAVYKGQYLFGKRDGFGEERGSDGHGNLYIGNWKSDKKHGQGMLCYLNGNVYIGNFEEDAATGKGMLYINLSRSKIEAEFVDGVANGEGKEVYTDGSFYSGNFSDGIKKGKGDFHFEDGSVYSGNFEDGRANGQGTYVYPNGHSTYKGEFKDNLQHGKGELKTTKGITYKGEFENGQKNGNGELIWDDGRKVVGQFKAGKFTGECKFISAKGKVKWARCEDGKKVEWIKGKKE